MTDKESGCGNDYYQVVWTCDWQEQKMLMICQKHNYAEMQQLRASETAKIRAGRWALTTRC